MLLFIFVVFINYIAKIMPVGGLHLSAASSILTIIKCKLSLFSLQKGGLCMEKNDVFMTGGRDLRPGKAGPLFRAFVPAWAEVKST